MSCHELLGLNAAQWPHAAAALTPASTSAPPTVQTIYLDEALSPLFSYDNSLVSEGRPMILHSRSDRQRPQVYGRAVPTRFSSRPVQVEVDTFDYVGHGGVPVQPLGFRRQLLLSLLQLGTVDRPGVPSRNAASASERRRGSLRAPIIFELSVTAQQSSPNGPFFRFQLSAQCKETARWQAVRRQVQLLTEHLREPTKSVPPDFAIQALTFHSIAQHVPVLSSTRFERHLNNLKIYSNMPTSTSTSSTAREMSLADGLIYFLRSSRRLREPATTATESPVVAWISFVYGVLLPQVAELFGVSMSTAAKWISDGNSGEYNVLQAVGTLYDTLLDQSEPNIRVGAQLLVNHLAKLADLQLRTYHRKARG